MQKLAIFFISIWVLFSGCAKVDMAHSMDYKANLIQNASFYVEKMGDSTSDSIESAHDLAQNAVESVESLDKNALKKAYLKKHFSVWEKKFPLPSKKDIFWAINAKSGFDESKKPINAQFFDSLVESMNIDSYPSMRKKAVMIKSANVRALPTNKPRFSKIDGYPFDRWQNSLIFAYTPIIVLHSDKSKEWLLVQSSFVSGWVKADEVAFISTKQARELMSADFVLPMEDKIPLYHNGLFLQNARVGMILATSAGKSAKGTKAKKGEKQKGRDSTRHIIAFKRDINGNAVKLRVDFDKNRFAPFPLEFSAENIAKMIDVIGAENYGWGGAYENRDCSSFVRDIFANVGVWLPRNSKAQVDYGKRAKGSEFIALPKDNDAKIATILSRAKPFRTIIWLKGHIMLYIGALQGNPIVAHQVWGISGGKSTEIFSSVSITTLEVRVDTRSGNVVANDENFKGTLLDRIEAMSVVE